MFLIYNIYVLYNPYGFILVVLRDVLLQQAERINSSQKVVSVCMCVQSKYVCHKYKICSRFPGVSKEGNHIILWKTKKEVLWCDCDITQYGN